MSVKHQKYTSCANVRSNLVVEDFLHFWAGHATYHQTEIEDSHVRPQSLAIGKIHTQQLLYERRVMLHYINGEVWIYPVDQEGISFQGISEQLGLPIAKFNVLGKILPCKIIQESIITFQTLPTPIVPDVHPIALGNACSNSRWKVKFIPEEDSALLTIFHEDQTMHWESLAHIWNVQQNHWWHAVGRHVEVTTHSDSIGVKINTYGNIMPLPLPDTLIVFLTLGLKVVLDSFASLQTPGVKMQLKWISTPIWEGTLPDILGIPFFRTLVGFFTKPWNAHQDVNFVGYGRRLGDDTTLKDLMHEKPIFSQKDYVVMIAQPSLSGGGPGGTGKKDWDLNVRNELAGALLPHGVNVASLPQMTETILRYHGRPKIQQALKSVSDDQRNEQLVQLAHQAGFHIQANQPRPNKPNNLGKKQKQDDLRNEVKNLDLEGITIEPGYLVSAGDNPVQQLSALIPKSTGVFLTKEAQVSTWLEDGKHISPDPLALFLVGCVEPKTTLQHETVCLPARDASSRPILLSGVIVQLGQVPVEFAPKKEATDTKEETSIVSITTWKEETEEEHWQEVLKQPSKTFMKLLDQHCEGVKVLANWGTSYHHQSKTSSKQQAESVQFHATVLTTQLAKLLRLSGIAGTYIVPKDYRGGTNDDWRVIWLNFPVKNQQAHNEAMRSLSKLDDPAGLVRSKSNYGIRVRSGDYAKAFAVIRPNDPIPEDIHGKQLYKITPFPFGTSPEAIKRWITEMKWEGFPVKPLEPQTWMIASANPLPGSFLTYNGHPMLARELPKKTKNPPPVIAGARLPQIADSKSAPSQDPWGLKNDPWSQYKPTTGSGGVNTSAVAPPTTGYVQQKLQQQDDKIATLTEDLQKLRASQSDLGTHLEKRVGKVNDTLEETKKTFANQLTQLQRDIESSLQGALQTQNQSITSGFKELKAMMQQQQEQRATPQRRSHEEMQRDDDTEM